MLLMSNPALPISKPLAHNQRTLDRSLPQPREIRRTPHHNPSLAKNRRMKLTHLNQVSRGQSLNRISPRQKNLALLE